MKTLVTQDKPPFGRLGIWARIFNVPVEAKLSMLHFNFLRNVFQERPEKKAKLGHFTRHRAPDGTRWIFYQFIKKI